MSDRLPESVRKLLWDVRVETADVKRHYRFFIRRVLDLGDVAALKWLRRNYPDEVIKQVVTEKRGLSPKTLAFWTAYFDSTRDRQHV